MRKLILLLLACGIYIGAFAQTEPQEPCCGIIKIDAVKNIVTARDKATGRLYQFKADALDMQAIKLNDAINVSAGKITSISGAKRTYVTVRPDPAEPCCNVVSIQPDPAEPCCAMVNIMNNTTNNKFTVSVPKQIAATLKTGQAVSINAENNLAVMQSSYGGSNGEMSSYGYPATSGDGTTGNENATDKWVINKVNAKSGTGKLFVTLPKGSEWDITIYSAGSSKVLSNTMLQQDFVLLPGSYDLEINHISVKGVPVEKGNNTRLKTGVLHITNPTSWTLYDEAKEKVLINSTSAQKRGVPIGKYKLTIMGQDQDIEIKDGETVEY
jgi:hypothetical protein